MKNSPFSMDYANMLLLLCSRKNWLVFLLAFIFCKVTTSEKVPNPGLLCISECVTCPVICSPPPSPSLPSKEPPPPQKPKSPPPKSQLPNSPPPKTQVPKTPPPFYYFTSPPTSQAPPRSNPPPSPIYTTVPSTGPQNNAKPYYYIYSSKATSVSQCSLFVLIVVFSMLLVNGRSA